MTTCSGPLAAFLRELSPMVLTSRPEKLRREGRGCRRSRIRAELLARDPRCAYCGRVLDERSATLDHVRSRSRQGSNDRSNLVLACAPCNARKGSSA